MATMPNGMTTGGGEVQEYDDMTIETLERKIQKLLLDFEEECGHRIDQVQVDTRNYANCSVQIFLK